jgi:uncharacterized delta-60 repeat protein
MNTDYTAIILSVGLFLALSIAISAAPGDLDSTFGTGGKVITPGIGAIDDIAIQPDGKIVAVSSERRIVRYNANGSLDSLFGTGGIVIVLLGDNTYLNSVAIQADGRIIAGGTYRVGTEYWIAVFRYNGDGTLDTTFNGTGYITTPYLSVYASEIAIQPDGKMVFAGDSYTGYLDSIVYRYNSNGTPDTSFGGTGRIIIQNSRAYSVAVQPDGKIVIAGDSSNGFTTFRHNADGSPDASFGSAGRVITHFPDIYNCPVCGDIGSYANQIIIQPDGKIVVKGDVGFSDVFNSYPVFVRHNPNGALDTTFGINGILQVLNPGNLRGEMTIQPDGKIVAVGFRSNPASYFDFLIARYNAFGSPDTTFNGEGWITADFGGQDDARVAAIQPDGKIVVAGFGDAAAASALARYQGGSNANIRTRFDFDGDGRADVSVFRPSDRTWYLNQSTNGFSATQWGLSTDKLVPADYDGDGKTDISVYRDGIWYWLNSSDNSFNARQFGIASDIPVPANYYTDGSGRAELAVYRSGTWWILNLANNQINTIQFGLAADKPVPSDYDGDGRTDIAVYRDGIWYLLRSTQGFAAVQFGVTTDKVVPADFDGDGKTDLAVYRDGVWYLLGSQAGFAAFQFGIPSDIPAPADYDGDGKTDPAVYRDGVWYLLQTTNGFAAAAFGLANDKPVSSAYLP